MQYKLKYILIFILLLFLAPFKLSAQLGTLPYSGAPIASTSFTPAWQPVHIGAGGQLTGIYDYADGTELIRADVYGGYLKVNAGSCTYGATIYAAPCWQNLVNATSLPLTTFTEADGGSGVHEIVACPSNTNVLYMFYRGSLYVSTNKGGRWWKTSQTTTGFANDFVGAGPYIACDPNNVDIVYAGTPSGVFKSTNGTAQANSGTTTWSAVSGLATPSGGKAVGIIAFQPGSSTHILIGVGGTGFYESTNGSTFSLTTGTPTTLVHIYADQFNQFWAGSFSGSLFKYASSTWTTITPGVEVDAIAIDPNSASVGANHIAVSDFTANLQISSDNGATWTTHLSNPNQSVSAPSPQPTWLGNANQIGNGAAGQLNLNGYSLSFDNSSNLRFAGGIGIWKTAAPVTTNPTVWTADSLGIEELVTTEVLAPPGGWTYYTAWDKGIFTLKSPDVFPSNYFDSTPPLHPIMSGWAADYAANGVVTTWETSNVSADTAPGISSDGGVTFSVWGGLPTNHGGAQGGTIAAQSSSNWIVAAFGHEIAFTSNGGASFTNSTIAGTPTDWAGFGGVGKQFAADRVAANTYCVVTHGGTVFYSSTNGGANFTATGATSANVDGFPNQSFLRSVPGKSGHYWYTAGVNGSFGSLWKSTDTCVTWTRPNTNMGPGAFGFGAQEPRTGTYPTVYVYGSSTKSTSSFGMYYSIDGGVTYNSIQAPASQLIWPLNSVDLVDIVVGDADVYGRIYVGFQQSGAAYIDTADACPWVKFDPSTIKPNQTVSGTFTITANHSGLVPVTSVQFQVDGTNIGSAQTGQTSYSVSWNTSGLSAGPHTLSVVTTGNGCTGAGSTQSFTVTK